MNAWEVTSADSELAPASTFELMAHALAIEIEACERYTELADIMETHNNRDVATLFRRMAAIERRHAEAIRVEMGWPADQAPVVERAAAEGPETVEPGDLHYLMQPYHALEVALAAEERAERFFRELARSATTASVRDAAQALAEEEREHVALVREWMTRVPPPQRDWAVDPDPPRYNE
jgi:rubrerythrin